MRFEPRLPAYRALMQWYPLFDRVKAFLGERLTIHLRTCDTTPRVKF